jgi:hypothetical protein
VPAGLCDAAVSLSLANRVVDKNSKQKNIDVRFYFSVARRLRNKTFMKLSPNSDFSRTIPKHAYRALGE